MSPSSKVSLITHGLRSSDTEIVKWIPTFDSSKSGLELLGQPLRASQVRGSIRSVRISDPATTAFLIVRLAVTGNADVVEAVAQALSVSLDVKVCLAVDHTALRHISADLLTHENVIFMLDVSQAETPLSALMSDAISALRIDPGLAWPGGSALMRVARCS